MMKTYLIWAGVIIVVVGGLWWGIKSQLPEGEDYSTAYPILGVEHIPIGSEHPAYNSNPPTSGWHYPITARVRFYEAGEVVPDEYLIHNLEHGDVWIAYHPRIPAEAREQLKDLVSAKVVVAPREANQTDIVLVAWGRLDAFNLSSGSLDEKRIKDFIKRYKNRGPEKIVGQPTTGFDPSR